MSIRRKRTPAGFRWVYCRYFVHYRTGKRVYRKNGGCFTFLVRC